MIESIVMGMESYFQAFLMNNNPRRNLELIKICTVFYSIITFEKSSKLEHLLKSPVYCSFSASMSKNLKNV